MSGKFLSFQETALALITQFGGPVLVTRKVPSAFDPVTQVETSTSPSEEFQGVMLPPSKEGAYKAQTLEFKFEAEFYLAMLGRSFTPRVGDTVLWSGRTYTIQHAQTYDPAGDGPIMTVAYGI